MPRKPIIRSNYHYYHVTARSNNKENFYLSKEKMWSLCLRKLSELEKEFKIQIGAFVLMDNHFHLLILTPEENIDRVMYFLMKHLTLRIQKHTKRINKIFGGRYKGCLIENHRYLMNVLKYIYRNPIAAGITENAQDYHFSTFHHYYFKKPLPFKVYAVLDFTPVSWINYSFTKDEAESMKFGLSKTQFTYKKDSTFRKLIIPN